MNCSCPARAHSFKREANMLDRVKIVSKDHNHGLPLLKFIPNVYKK